MKKSIKDIDAFWISWSESWTFGNKQMYKTLYLFKETGFQFIHLQLKPGYVALLFFYTSLFLSDDLNVICVTQICNQKYEFWEDICVNGFFLTTNLIIVFLCEGVMFPCDLINFDVIVYIKPMHIRNNICEVILLQHQRFKDHVWNRSNIHRLKHDGILWLYLLL